MAIVFVVATSTLSLRLAPQVNSPDEAVNLAFIERFAESFDLQITASGVTQEFGLAPRSVSFEFGAYVPAVFIGMLIIYGMLAAVFGAGAVWVFTPIAAGLAGLAFFSLIRRVWGSSTAVVSALLYFLHPVLWYYTVRGLYHNVLFLSLLIIGLWLVVARPLKYEWGNDVLAFGVIGASLAVRGAEAVWVGAALLLMWLLTKGWKRIQQTAIWIGLGVVSVAVVWSVQPGLLFGGYVLGESSLSNLLFPFGFHPRAILTNTWQYLIMLSGVVGVFSLIGWGVSVWKLKAGKKSAVKLYTIIFTLVAWYPLAVYGSWVFADNPTPWLVTIGNSYLRYWLPVLIFALPFVGYAVTYVFHWLLKRDKKYAGGFWFAVFVLWLVGSVSLFYAGNDGYAQVYAQAQFAQQTKEVVLEITQPDDVIMVEAWDKVFWPDRDVGRGLFTVEGLERAGDAMFNNDENGFWYFGLRMSAEQEEFLQNEQAILSIPHAEFGDHMLYKLTFPPSYE